MTDQLNFDNEPPKLRLAVQNDRPAAAVAAPDLPGQAYARQDHAAADQPHLLDYVKVLYKRRSVAATAFLLVLVSAILYTFTATPVFEARTRLLIESDQQNVVSFKQVVEQDQAKADYYQTQYNVLQSRALARRTLEGLKLWDRQPFGGAPDEPAFSVAGALAGAARFVSGAFTSEAQPEDAPAPDETGAQSAAIDVLLAHLTVAPIRNSRLVDVKFRLPDAALATAIVNSVAKNYIEQDLEYKFVASKDASDWLGERLAEQRVQVEGAEAKLQQYRERNDAIALEDRENIVVQKLTDLNAAVTRAKTERIQKEAMYNQLRTIQSDSAALDTFPAILANTFIQQQKADLASLQQQLAQLSDELGEKHPDIIKAKTAIGASQRKLQAEITTVVQAVRNEYRAALAQEHSLTSALGQQKGEAQSMNRKAIDYGALAREVESSKSLYDSLLQRAKETGVAGELKTSNIRIVDRAEKPRAPVTPRTRLNLSLALLGGLVLSVGLAFFFEYVDSRIKSPDEITAHLGLPALGMVPALDAKSWKGAEPLVTAGVPPHFAEAFRGVRTNVLFSSAEEGPRTLVVTSTAPGEGKTTVAANLAIGLAQVGQRVLLMDADMRRPRVHDVFSQPQEPGLSNLLVGSARPSESVRKTGVPGLWVMTAGHLPPNPAELLGSQRFKEILGTLKEHFDWVILDTPPVMAVTDSTIAANSASGVVFVVGAEMTSRHAARRALDQLQLGRARFVGAVLNRVELDKNAYYYSHYYRREYGAYYQQAANAR